MVRMPCGRVARKLAENDGTPDVELLRRRAKDVVLGGWARHVWIQVNLQHVQPQRVVIPCPEIVCARASQRGEHAGMLFMDQIAQSTHHDGENLKRERT